MYTATPQTNPFKMKGTCHEKIVMPGSGQPVIVRQRMFFFASSGAGIRAARGLEAGIPSLPYYTFSKKGLLELNDKMVEYNVPFTLAETFQAVYGMALEDFEPTGYQEKIFTNQTEANLAFQKILKSKNIPHAERYIFTSIDSAREEGWMLVSLVYRSAVTIKVADKYDPSVIRTLTAEDREFFRPYQTDISGTPLDTVYEWAALPVDSYSRQARQAVLLTLTANKVVEKKPRPEYWEKEKQWISGDHESIALEQDRVYREFLGIHE